MPFWFKPRCPLDTGEKAWTEYRLRWLVDRFGLDLINRVEFLLPEDLWAKPWKGTEAEAQEILDRVCAHMETPRERLSLEFVDDDQLPNAVGHYDYSDWRPTIRIARSQLEDPVALSATLAHEVAHDVLLAGKYQTGNEADLEDVTDLLPTIYGAGLFAANATVRSTNWRSGNWEGWNISKQGYLPSRTFGYAFALLTLFRDECDPPWAERLRPDAAETFRLGLKFLRGGGDTLFHPASYRSDRGDPTPGELLQQLQHASPTFRLAALWDVAEPDAVTVDAVVDCLGDRDPHVAAAAGHRLAELDFIHERGRDELVRRLESPIEIVRLGVIHAVGRLRLSPGESLGILKRLLFHESRAVSLAAVIAVGRFGEEASALAPQLVKALERANVRRDPDAIEAAAKAIWNLVPIPDDLLRDVYAGGDRELYQLARSALRSTRIAGR
ncbi:hypothetical protein LBMAG47_13520 [Planctomycetia bacterium]|nr:hypothetical protein LBMAG47_13520 [Planctomycetia bacterium]